MKSVKIASLLLASGMLLGSVHSAVTPAYTAHAADNQVLVDESKRVKLEYGDVSVDANGIITGIIVAAPPTTENPNNSGMSMGKLMTLFNGGELVIPKELINPETDAVTPIKGIGANAFYKFNYPVGDKSGIAKLTFDAPENITSIGNNAFLGNTISGELNLENVTTIGDHAFDGNELTSVKLPKVTSIGNHAFNNNAIEDELYLPAVTYIDGWAFYGNALTGVNLPKNPTIGIQAFTDQKLKFKVTKKANKQGEILLHDVFSPSLKVGNSNWNPEPLYVIVRKIISGEVSSTSEKITLKNSESAKVSLRVEFDAEDVGDYSVHSMELTINPYDFSDPIPSPGEESNGNNTSTTPGTNAPDTNNPDTNTPDTGNNESPITISPDPDVNRPHTVYAKRAMRLHSNVSLTNPTKSYKKQSRAKAASFRIQGVSYDKNGKKRYKVKGGYITASSKYVADSHFRSNKVKQVRVIGNKVNSYKNAKLSKSQQVRSYKKGTKLKVKRIVKQGRTTRFQLNNGRYITGNKQLLIMDHSK